MLQTAIACPDAGFPACIPVGQTARMRDIALRT